MSEQNSLFAKITINKENLTRFLQAKPELPVFDKDWQDWWDSREMYHKEPLTAEKPFTYKAPKNEAIIAEWQEEAGSLTNSEYDEATQTWYFSIVLFSENFREMLPMIAFLKSIAKYKEQSADDFAVIYNFYWDGDDVSAYLSYDENNPSLSSTIKNKSDLPTNELEFANRYLEKQYAEFVKKYSEKYD